MCMYVCVIAAYNLIMCYKLLHQVNPQLNVLKHRCNATQNTSVFLNVLIVKLWQKT